MENNYRHTNTTISLINYHFVFCPRYRRKIFLIPNVDNDLKGINQQKCNERFENFLTLHNIEVERLTGYKNLSSIAI